MKLLNTFLSLVFLLCFSQSFGQALQDWPCTGLLGSSLLTINAPCAPITTAAVGATDLDPGSCGSANVDDGWAWFVGDGNTATVDFTALNQNGILHVYELTAPPCGGVINVYCSNNAGTANESLTFPTALGNTYLIRIQRNASNNTITGCLGVTTTVPLPGCTDPSATNYNPLATVDDGSCTYPGVDYVHPTAGGAGEFVGACMVNDCGPFVYTDDGGLTNNYSVNIGPGGAPHYGGIYRVFCPDQAGNCMQATFTSFNTEASYDYLQVKNGPTQNSPEFAALHTPSIYGPNGMQGNLTASMPVTYTATDASGCLTFRFYSDNTVTAPGWSATLQCVPCAGGPNGTDNNDCQTLTPLCNTYSLSGDATGPGLVSDGCTFGICPAGGENYSNWFTFTANNAGTLDITLTPSDLADDYDFAVYGPNVTCATLGTPLRCSDAAATGVTGTGGDTDLSEPAAGNGQVASFTANAGDSYILVVDEWSPNAGGTGFDLAFGGTATLDCSVLPVELSEFDASYLPEEHVVDLMWITQSEKNCAKFEVQRSTDGVNYETIYTVDGAGTTINQTHYYVADPNPSIGINYYRLNQIDTDGASRRSEVRSVNILDDVYDLLSFYPNPTSGQTEVIFNSYKKETVQLQVLGFDGKVVVKTELQAEKGGNRFDLDLSSVDGSIYMVTITTSDKVYSGKLIKK